jgi:hypothetical protein
MMTIPPRHSEETGTPAVLDRQQWQWWCQDNKATLDKHLGHANCPVCHTEPTGVLAWICNPPCQPGIAHHVKFEGCGHRADVART